jgi:OmpA-OmpF porin, OOP family
MKKILSAIFALYLLMPAVHAQKGEYKMEPAIGISFFLNDFITPDRIRTTSLSQVLADKKFARKSQMAPGLAISYFKGLADHVDFVGSIGGSFVNYPMPGRAFASDNFLLEASAQVNLKMTTDQYWVQPYIIAGVAAHKYRSYYGATLPLGFGMKVNFFDEAYLIISSTYRVPVTTETANYSFQHSIGIAGSFLKKKISQ